MGRSRCPRRSRRRPQSARWDRSSSRFPKNGIFPRPTGARKPESRLRGFEARRCNTVVTAACRVLAGRQAVRFAAKSPPQHRMVIEHVFPDRWRLNGAEQDPRRLQIIRLHAQADDLAYRGIAQQFVGHLDGDFHRGLGGAFVAVGLVFALVVRAVGKAGYFFSAIGGGTADIADLVRRLDIADRPLDFLVPDVLALVLAEPPHRPRPEYLTSIDGPRWRGDMCFRTSPEPPARFFRG